MIDYYDNSCLYTDTYTIIEMMDDSMRNKISSDFIKFLKFHKNNEFKGTVDRNIPIKEQVLRNEIKIMLSLIYINYLCNKEDKDRILKEEEKNINIFYNKNIFDNVKKTENVVNNNEKIANNSNNENMNKDGIDSKNTSINNEAKQLSLIMVNDKENVIQKFINKIKFWFNSFRK